MIPRRREAGIRRWLRNPSIRRVLHEKAHPKPGRGPIEWGPPWTSLAYFEKFSWACRCHKGPRYRDSDRYRDKRVSAA